MNAEDDLNQGLKELITRYRLQMEEKDATIEALNADLIALTMLAVSRGELKEAPGTEPYPGVR